MKKAAFAAVAVLAVVVLSGSSLLSQPTDTKAQRVTDAALPNLGSATTEPRFGFDARNVLDQGKGAAYPGGGSEEDVWRRLTGRRASSRAAYPGGGSEEDVLRWKLRKLVEKDSKTISADELRETIRVMEQLTIEPEFAPIIEQLRPIAERGQDSVAVRKAALAIQLLKTSDPHVLSKLFEAITGSPPVPEVPPHLQRR